MKTTKSVVIPLMLTTGDDMANIKLSPIQGELEVTCFHSELWNENLNKVVSKTEAIPTSFNIKGMGYSQPITERPVVQAIYDKLINLEKEIEYSVSRERVVSEIPASDIPEVRRSIVLQNLFNDPEMVSKDDLSMLGVDALFVPQTMFNEFVVRAEMFAISASPKLITGEGITQNVLNNLLFKVSPNKDFDFSFTGSKLFDVKRAMDYILRYPIPDFYAEKYALAQALPKTFGTVSNVLNQLNNSMLEYSMYNDKELRDIIREIGENTDLNYGKSLEEEKAKISFDLKSRLDRELDNAPDIFKYVAENRKLGDFFVLIQRPNMFFSETAKETNLKGGELYSNIKREFSLADKFESITTLDPSVDGAIPMEKKEIKKSDPFEM